MKRILVFVFSLMCLISLAKADIIKTVIESTPERQSAVEWVVAQAVLPNRAKLPRHKAKQYVDLAYEAAWKYDLDPKLILGMMHQESRFYEKARSAYGAVGLLQVVPRWHKARFKGNNYTDPRQNVFAGASYLRELLNKAGSTQRAVRLYSGGASAYYTKIHKHRSSLIAHLNDKPKFVYVAQSNIQVTKIPYARDQIGVLLAMKENETYEH